MSDNEKKLHDALFLQLIIQFQTSAMIGMGKLKNPITNNVEVDLDAAKLAIDMIDMLNEKTRGNLTEDEKRFITTVSRDLKLNYIVELDKAQKEKQSSKETPS